MYIAVIEPCKYTGGAYWVNSRRHILVQAPRNQGRLAAELRLAGVSHAIAAAIAASVLGKGPWPQHAAGYDYAPVDPSAGVDDTWPSAGDGSAWGWDPWLAVADLCSYGYWVAAGASEGAGYPMPDAPTLRRMIAAAGLADVAAAIRLIRDQRHRAALNRLMRIAA